MRKISQFFLHKRIHLQHRRWSFCLHIYVHLSHLNSSHKPLTKGAQVWEIPERTQLQQIKSSLLKACTQQLLFVGQYILLSVEANRSEIYLMSLLIIEILIVIRKLIHWYLPSKLWLTEIIYYVGGTWLH